ncbi:hypothetical protein TNCV_572451 [Trichonephila clavipes]|nr:hypothetical protein TNCV_572451 [Trichonephila clavipes]
MPSSPTSMAISPHLKTEQKSGLRFFGDKVFLERCNKDTTTVLVRYSTIISINLDCIVGNAVKRTWHLSRVENR